MPTRRFLSYRANSASHGHGQQLGDYPPDAKPDQLSVTLAAIQHLISASGCHNLSVATVLADQQVGGTPDVAVWDHFDFIPLGENSSPSTTRTAGRSVPSLRNTPTRQIWGGK